MLIVEDNAKKLNKKILAFAKRLDARDPSRDSIVNNVMAASLDLVGNIAVRDYSIPTDSITDAILAPVDDEKFTHRSNRLARSLLGERLFKFVNFGSMTKAQLEMILSNEKAPIPGENAHGRNEAIRRVVTSGGKILGQWGSKTPYAKKINDKRPFGEPAIKDARPKIFKMFETAIRGEWKRL